MTTIQAYAATEAGGQFHPMDVELPTLPATHVEIEVESCGICHSDLSMRDDEWHMTEYPFVGGHEVIGRVVAVGDQAQSHAVGDRVGLGWFANSCMACSQCLGGDQNLCLEAEGTITHQFGGFADRVRCHWAWAANIPESLPAEKCGPLLCGGITVFNPLDLHGLKPTDRAAVIGIGGLGHLAIQFLNAWGCEVTAFTSSDSKAQEARDLGAHHVINSTDPAAIEAAAGRFDLIVSTVNVTLDWNSYAMALSPRGRLHFVGAVLEPLSIGLFPLLLGERSISSSPVGPPATIARMLDFAARHQIAPVVEHFPMSRVNDALDHLRAGKARYRIVLDQD
jgi:uncharacterized zinc-type alcohol dehydrogenase-like protein